MGGVGFSVRRSLIFLLQNWISALKRALFFEIYKPCSQNRRGRWRVSGSFSRAAAETAATVVSAGDSVG